jgi:putative transposase
MRKTFKFKLFKPKNNKLLNQRINIAAGVWNHCVALHKRYYRLFGKSLNWSMSICFEVGLNNGKI